MTDDVRRIKNSLLLDLEGELEIAKSPEDDDGYNYMLTKIEETALSEDVKQRYIAIIDNASTYPEGLENLISTIIEEIY